MIDHKQIGYRDGMRSSNGNPPEGTNEAFDYWLGWHEGHNAASVFKCCPPEWRDWLAQ